MTGYVYCMKNPSTNEIFYVGSTTKEAEIRFKAHLSGIKRGSNRLYIWLKESGITPTMEVLESVIYKKRAALLDREDFWITKLLNEGSPLKNIGSTSGKKIIRDPNGSGSVKIDAEVLVEAKRLCKTRGLMINFFATQAIKEKIKRDFK